MTPLTDDEIAEIEQKYLTRYNSELGRLVAGLRAARARVRELEAKMRLLDMTTRPRRQDDPPLYNFNALDPQCLLEIVTKGASNG